VPGKYNVQQAVLAQHNRDGFVGARPIVLLTPRRQRRWSRRDRPLHSSSKKTLGDLFDSYTYEKIHSHAGVRYDLFREGAEAARSRLVTDFFGNVQNVEVDGTKNTTFEEDLLSLSKTIAALHKKAEEEEAAASNNATPVAIKAPAPASKKIQLAKPLTDDNWWSKKILGATALAGCALIWGLGSFLESPRM
jgi:GPI-anchor transamidase subunit K